MYYLPVRNTFILTRSGFYAIQAWKKILGFTKTRDTQFMYKVFLDTAKEKLFFPYWHANVSREVFPYGPFLQYMADTYILYKVRIRNIGRIIRTVFEKYRIHRSVSVVRKIHVFLPLYDDVQHEQLRLIKFHDGDIVKEDLVKIENTRQAQKEIDAILAGENPPPEPGKAEILSFPGAK